MKIKIIISSLILFFTFALYSNTIIPVTEAQIIPTPETDFDNWVKNQEGEYDSIADDCDTSTEIKFKETIRVLENSSPGSYLSCKIQTGTFLAADIPYYLTYIADFLLGIVGLISTLFIVIGGYNYIIGGISEEKEKGKNTIKHAIMGLVIALLAWAVVNSVIALVT